MACLAGRTSTDCSTDLAPKRRLALFCALLVLLSVPALAQNQSPESELESLIPDAAVTDPEAWAKAAPVITSTQAPIARDLAPDSPLTPDDALAKDGFLQLPWPDEQFELPPVLALEPETFPDVNLAQDSAPLEVVPQRNGGDVQQISPRLSLVFPSDPVRFTQRAEFVQRFLALSAIHRLAKDGEENPAQLAARARTDASLLNRMLRHYGHYDGEVEQSIVNSADGAALAVRFVVTPGPRYRFGVISLGDLDSVQNTSLGLTFGIVAGDPINTDRIVAGRNALDLALAESGYAFARLGEPDLLIDHSRELGDLSLPVSPGGAYRYAGASSSLPDFLPAKHIERIARFDRGDLFKRSQVEDLRRAIIATGLVSSVSITPRETKPPVGEVPGDVALDIAMAKAPLRTIAGAIGYDSGEGFRLEASWEHRNLFPPEGMLRLRGVAGTKEQLAGITIRRNNFRGRDQVLTIDLYGNSVKRDAYIARTAVLSVNYEKLTTLVFQKPWVWSIGLEAIATREREGDVDGLGTPPENYYVIALPLRAAFDTSDNLLDPTKGFRAALRASPEFSFDQGRKANYVRIQADVSAYLPIGNRAVLAARGRLGTIPGADIRNIAPSRRFYAGGGGSVRGYGYQQIGPRNSFSAPSGGRSLSEFSIEARVKTGLFGGGLSIVPFIDAGTVEDTVRPRFADMRYGAGIGLRYQTGFGPIRIDVGTPINRREGESRVAVYVSLGQAF